MPSAPKWIFDTVEFLMPKSPLAEVVDTMFLSKSVKRIRFKGDFRNLKFPVGSYIDFRVSDTKSRRYTVSYIDRETGILELLVYLHGDTYGSRFMNNLKAGDRLPVNQPRARRYNEKSAERLVIFGDETSLGLACSFFSLLEGNRIQFQFYFELDDENKKIPEILKLKNYKVFPKDGSFRSEEWIYNVLAVETPEWPEASFVLTGNARSAQTFRRVVKNKTLGKVHVCGHWLEGRKGL